MKFPLIIQRRIFLNFRFRGTRPAYSGPPKHFDTTRAGTGAPQQVDGGAGDAAS